MKTAHILGFLSATLMSLIVFSGTIFANEGVFEMGSVNNSGSTCYAVSIFIDGRYEIGATCRNLTVPYSAELTRYVLWAVDGDGDVVRIGEVRNGKIDDSYGARFNTLYVTAEGGSQPRKPGSVVVARGDVKSIPTLGEEKVEVNVTVTPTPTPEVVSKPGERSSLTRILATVGRIIGVTFLILLVAVVIMTIITRRKERI